MCLFCMLFAFHAVRAQRGFVDPPQEQGTYTFNHFNYCFGADFNSANIVKTYTRVITLTYHKKRIYVTQYMLSVQCKLSQK